jgi:hypothetical protein
MGRDSTDLEITGRVLTLLRRIATGGVTRSIDRMICSSFRLDGCRQPKEERFLTLNPSTSTPSSHPQYRALNVGSDNHTHT